jgi:hypothetical protein
MSNQLSDQVPGVATSIVKPAPAYTATASRVCPHQLVPRRHRPAKAAATVRQGCGHMCLTWRLYEQMQAAQRRTCSTSMTG